MKELEKNAKKLFSLIMDYLDSHEDADREEGAAAFILCKEEKKAEKLISFMKKNPDINSYDLFLKATEIAGIECKR